MDFEPHVDDVPTESEDVRMSDLWNVAVNKLNTDAACSWMTSSEMIMQSPQGRSVLN